MRYEILKNGEVVNTIVSGPDFIEDYCKANGYTYGLIPEPEPIPEPETSVWDELDAAYQEGVDSV